MKKGSQMAVAGSIQTRNFEDKEGKKRKVTEILVNSVTFLTPYEAKKEDDVPLVEIADEDMPF
jgi:single-strand DNA-binding protein